MTSANADVLLEVLRYSDLADKPALCLVNRLFFQVARDDLYRHFNHPNVVGACRTMVQYKHLALLVESFEINILSRLGEQSAFAIEPPVWGKPPSPPTPQQLEVIRSALQLMRNLHTLKFLMEGDYAHILNACTTIWKLRTFHCHLYSNSHLFRFLMAQPTIVDLQIKHPATIIDFELEPPNATLDALPRSSHLRNLHTLEVPLSLAHSLVKGRPICNLRITTYLSSATLSFLSQSAKPLRKLEVPLPLLCNLSPQATSEILPELEELVIQNLGTWTEFQPTHINWCKDFVSFQGTLKALIVLGVRIRPQGLGHYDEEIHPAAGLRTAASDCMTDITSAAHSSLRTFVILVKTAFTSFKFGWERVNGSWKELQVI